jgi:hypothetical protein
MVYGTYEYQGKPEYQAYGQPARWAVYENTIVFQKQMSGTVVWGTIYGIPIEVKSSASLLDWIFQVWEKPWASPKVMGELLDLIEEYINPQSTLCAWGVEQKNRING